MVMTNVEYERSLTQITQILERLGEDTMRPGLIETPGRWLNAMQELTGGYESAEAAFEGWFTTFDAEGADQMICQWNIPLYSLCEHHILPFAGYAHIGYIPRDLIVGLSKFKRVVDVYARRLQVQERLTRQVADTLHKAVNPRGVIVVVEAEHFCMTMRGVQAPGTLTTTHAVKGDFLDPSQGSREEFMSMLGNMRRR